MADLNNVAAVQEEIEQIVSDPKFLSMTYAGAEIPNYILPFPPEKQLQYSQMALNLKDRMNLNGITTICINMYDEILNIIDGEGSLDDYLAADDLTRQELYEDFSNVLDMNDVFAPHIADIINSSDAKLVIFSGIGEAYPFVRIHALLEALPVYMKNQKPIVVFYPGYYDKQTGNSCFRLFGKLNPVNYYRAFNIFSEVK